MVKHTLTPAERKKRFIRLILITSLVVAAAAYPATAGLGMLAKIGADAYGNMPATLLATQPPETTYVYASDGKTLVTTFYEEDRKYTPLTSISPLVQEAIVAAEDSRFFQHHGVDWRGTVRAFIANQQAGTVAQGASTLTMQYVRNVLRDNATSPQQAVDATVQNADRKIREMKLALNLEKTMTKKQILEGYLNVAYFGHQAYGIYAAAETYFSKPPSELTLEEAALVAGLVQAPSSYDPAGSNQTAARNRRNYVLDRMQQLEYISPGEAKQAEQAPITLHLSDQPQGCTSVPADHNDWGFFCDEFRSWWSQQPAFGKNPDERLENLSRGGYTIVLSLDPKVQTAAMSRTLSAENTSSPFALGSVFVEPGTGLIKAMAVNRKYSLDTSGNGPSTSPDNRAAGVPGNYPNTVTPLLGGGGINGYQAGSTFKLFTMLAALEGGLTLNTKIYSPMTITTPYLGGAGLSACGIYYCPSNASAAMTGYQTMWSGWGESVNTYWIQVEERIGAQNAVAMAERLGLTWHTDVDQEQASAQKAAGWGSFTLGVADTTPLEMAGAYATVAADGKFCQPLPVASITGPDGKPVTTKGANGTQVPVASPRCTQVISPGIARGAVDAMRCTTGYNAAAGPCGSWSTAPGAYGEAGRPFAGKTGTTDSTRAAWFAGVTPQLAGASFVADPDEPSDAVGDAESEKPVDVVALTVHDALAGVPVVNFTPPPANIVGTPQA
ncbi:transglycosylase/D,D-transpeptidase PonA2 [Rugosimonospora acidiphila]|uniref:Transglycosylase/D,D-transpeptidase PonA2 n=1 Tax=Rugosimonospora acidiphila TaxID=556531 RepID=A0ABP9RQR3_9ACTN